LFPLAFVVLSCCGLHLVVCYLMSGSVVVYGSILVSGSRMVFSFFLFAFSLVFFVCWWRVIYIVLLRRVECSTVSTSSEKYFSRPVCPGFEPCTKPDYCPTCTEFANCTYPDYFRHYHYVTAESASTSGLPAWKDTRGRWVRARAADSAACVRWHCKSVLDECPEDFYYQQLLLTQRVRSVT
jgi:hypothetical protein